MGKSTEIALLRGVNVGGKNRLPMKELTAVFAAAGCVRVETFIQSGNVIFERPAARAKEIPTRIERELAARFGHPIPLVIRTASELQAVVKLNPFLAAGADPDSLHVGFLAAKPSAKAVAALDPERSPPDEFIVRGREIYFRFPAGLARSKLTNAYFDRVLETTSTVRNWRTVLALCELASV